MIERLEILKSGRGQFENENELSSRFRNDNEFKREVEALYYYYFDTKVSGCSNCYIDAYFRLITLTKEKAMEKEKLQFKLLAGALLEDVVNYDVSKAMSNANITEELSLYHLKTNPNSRKYFQKLPENVDELIENFSIDDNESESESKMDEKDAEVIVSEKVKATKSRKAR